MKKINKYHSIKPVIFINLKIKEFPLKNYSIKEKKTSANDIDIDKAYILEKNEPTNIKNNNNLNINQLEKLLKEERDENAELNNKNKELEKKLNTELEKNYNLNKKIKDLESKLSRYPFELLEGENLISVIFYSMNQHVHTSILCKNTDLFVNIELKFYEEYPEYKGKNYYFTVNGRQINKYQTLKENGIKNSNVILLQENLFYSNRSIGTNEL